MEMLQFVFGGLGIFLLGMKMMSDGLQTMAGRKLSKLISAATDNRWMAVVVGIGLTAIIQSSSATTVMVVGLVNGGVMTLMQSIGVIFGANIGTTVTAWIITMNLSKYGLIMVAVAVVPYLFSDKDKVKNGALGLLGVGLLFVGLELMGKGLTPLRSDPAVMAMFQRFDATSSTGLLKCILTGTVVTMIIQASAASIAIIIMLVKGGLIGFDTALALTLGGNIGTTITAFLASIGTSRNARRAAYVHILFNVFGVIWIASVFHIGFVSLVKWVTEHAAVIWPQDALDASLYNGPDREYFRFAIFGIAVGHTVFNTVNVLLFLPIMGWFAKVVRWMVPVHDSEILAETTKKTLGFLDKRMLASPLLAIEQSKKEILAMGEMNQRMLSRLKTVLLDTGKCEEDVLFIMEGENLLDEAESRVIEFVSNLIANRVAHTHAIAAEARRQLRQADEFESVSDYIVRVMKSRNRMLKTGGPLSAEMRRELADLHLLATTYINSVLDLLREPKPEHLAHCRKINDDMLRAIKDVRKKYEQRLVDDKLTTARSIIYSDILVEFRRIKDHLQNIVDTQEE